MRHTVLSAERIAGTLADALQVGDYRRVLVRLQNNNATRIYRFDLWRNGNFLAVKVTNKRNLADTGSRLVHVSKVKAI
jgi:hypothetical protein